MHDQTPIGMVLYQRQIMGNHQDGHGVFSLQAVEQQENLPRDSDVECRSGLVCNKQLGIASDRHRYHHPLTLAP
ncbi:hypothetical protein CCOS865_04060 [Pseudomonas reidholzensis]|uniref:Uncharacterized protein n=1 Tax=Pseudomonas reidholzensis TaxID=1785162 RepID=A0A383RXG7_9PSED|nr:hypothetical protein CCOS865_04060 [Pseudomonas reidholzensis]